MEQTHARVLNLQRFAAIYQFATVYRYFKQGATLGSQYKMGTLFLLILRSWY